MISLQRQYELHQNRLLDEYLEACEDKRTEKEIEHDKWRIEDAQVEKYLRDKEERN